MLEGSELDCIFYPWQVESGFSQPNGSTAPAMLEWALSASKGLSGGLLELYCGNANFTVALAPSFTRVVATEVFSCS